MGYFSNGTEGEIYQATYCDNCVHWRDLGDGRGYGCPIIDLHMLYNYDQHPEHSNNPEQAERTANMLNELIPRSENGLYNEQCRMFWDKRPEARE